jgi:hypothetical protein
MWRELTLHAHCLYTVKALHACYNRCSVHIMQLALLLAVLQLQAYNTYTFTACANKGTPRTTNTNNSMCTTHTVNNTNTMTCYRVLDLIALSKTAAGELLLRHCTDKLPVTAVVMPQLRDRRDLQVSCNGNV